MHVMLKGVSVAGMLTLTAACGVGDSDESSKISTSELGRPLPGAFSPLPASGTARFVFFDGHKEFELDVAIARKGDKLRTLTADGPGSAITSTVLPNGEQLPSDDQLSPFSRVLGAMPPASTSTAIGTQWTRTLPDALLGRFRARDASGVFHETDAKVVTTGNAGGARIVRIALERRRVRVGQDGKKPLDGIDAVGTADLLVSDAFTIPLRVAYLGQDAGRYETRMTVEAAQRAGHHIELYCLRSLTGLPKGVLAAAPELRGASEPDAFSRCYAGGAQ